MTIGGSAQGQSADAEHAGGRARRARCPGVLGRGAFGLRGEQESVGPERSSRLCGLVLLALVALPSGVSAQDGWYVRMELGAALAPGMTVHGSDDDWSTKCDLLSNPAQVETDPASCASAPPRAEWYSDVDGGAGTMGGLVLGYSVNRLRIEAAYSFRATTYGGPAPPVIGDEITLGKADQELEEAEAGVDDVHAHGFFVNLAYELRSASRYKPYVGAGAGMALTKLDYYTRWKRNDDPDRITTFDDPFMRARIAGTTSISDLKLSDVLASYRVFAGVDYEMNDGVSVGLQLRWTGHREFEDEAEYAQIRSHESSVGRGFDVHYRAETSGLAALGVAFSMEWRLA